MAPRDEYEANPFAAPETDLRSDGAFQSEEGWEYAGFLQRFIAAFLDGIIVQILGFVMGFALGIVMGSIGLGKMAGLAGGVAGFVLGWLYSALQESSETRATLGKKAMGLTVVTLEGQQISFMQATGRHFAKILSGIILLIGYLMQPFTQKKQALHDILAGTLVVKARR